MKNFTKCVAMMTSCLIIALFFSACNEEQTSFSLDDITGRAKIVGNLSYSEGQAYEDSVFTEKVKYAVGKKVYVEINNSEFSPHASTGGYTSFETVTDENGNYEIEIPAVATGRGVQVLIRAENFLGTQSFVKSTEDGKPIFETRQVIFTSPIESYSLKPDELIAVDFKYIAKERDLDEGLTEVATLKVKIGVGKLEANRNYWGGTPYFSFREGITALVTTLHEEYRDGYYNTVERKYSFVTNAAGEAMLQIPVREKKGYLRAEIEVTPFRENNFIYYRYYDEFYELTGIYRQYQGGFIKSQDYGILYYDEYSTHQLEVRMVFDADSGQNYYYSPNDYNWDGTAFEY